MSRRTKNLWAGALLAGGVALAVALSPALLPGNDASQSAPSPKAQRLVVHEWGTFTSFSGSDGVNLEYRPLVANDLPGFVVNPFQRSELMLSKREIYGLQRMETPVAYFYTDGPRTVNVRVDFPKGMLTDWYPIVKSFEAGQPTPERAMGQAYLDWGRVRLIPQEQFADVRVRGSKGATGAFLPPVTADDPYGRARETDAAVVEAVDDQKRSHFEKFLFYRGVGNFEMPIKLFPLGNDRFNITNAGDEASGAMLLVHIGSGGRVYFTRLDPVAAHADIEVQLPDRVSTVDQLSSAMVRELTATGLYEKESLAMVNTWRTSWFGEQGTRLLYLVPGKLTDELLPLTIDPTPDEVVRVLVGRLETLTPEDGEYYAKRLAGDGTYKPTPEDVQRELVPLGRFAEPALQFMIGQTSDAARRAQLESILKELRRSGNSEK